MAEIKKVPAKLSMRMLYDMIEELQKQFNTQKQLTDETQQKIDNIEARMKQRADAMAKQIGEMEKSINLQADEYSKNVKELDDSLSQLGEAVKKQIDALNAVQAQDESVIQRCAENINAVNEKAETLIKQLNTVAQKTLQNVESIKTMVSVYQQLQGAVKNIKPEPAPMDTLKHLVRDINQMVNGLE